MDQIPTPKSTVPRLPKPLLPAFLAPLTAPASGIYVRIMSMRNRRFDRGLGVQRIDRPVISIGNITLGGTGKTPMVAWIARRLAEAGIDTVIAMRGYRARSGEVSDEQAEYRAMMPGSHVLARPDRIGALREFLPKHPNVRCVLLDDGFQHRQLHRDLDLVLIDATAGTFTDRVVPAGRLREPLSSLRRADAVIVTHASIVSPDLTSQIEHDHGKSPLAWTRHIWTSLDIRQHDSHPKPQPPQWLRGKRVITMLGIGSPQPVLDQLHALGATVVASISASDHERYDRPKLAMARGLVAGGDALVVTGKDWVKIASLIDWSNRQWPVPIVVPQLAIEVFEGEASLRDRILTAIRSPTG